jgi:hypothetical protein
MKWSTLARGMMAKNETAKRLDHEQKSWEKDEHTDEYQSLGIRFRKVERPLELGQSKNKIEQGGLRTDMGMKIKSKFIPTYIVSDYQETKSKTTPNKKQTKLCAIA